ncbi:MAG: Na+/H+ antiporter NhaC family protein [Dermabacter sp.]|nr:Na+/H+ antiporter NhaC family protein [Dermabacter sp.]
MVSSLPILTLVPPLLAIVLVIATKRVLTSLAVGIVASALLIADFSPLGAVREVGQAALGLVWDDGVNWSTILILTFLLELGMVTALVLMAGGTSAFSAWASRRIHTRRGSQALTGVLGMIIFVDDYFNALAVGQVARPITDRLRVSRAKLAYLIDSSSAPVVVLAPFSSWGASIIGIMAPILAASTLGMSEVGAFMWAALMNYYAIAAIALLWLSIWWRLDFGPMRREEARAVNKGGLHAPGDTPPGQLTDSLPTHEPGAMRALIVPFALLVVGVIGGMLVTGMFAAGTADPVVAMAEANVALSLNVGGLAGLVAAAYYCVRYTWRNPEFTGAIRLRGALDGARSMLPAILILLLAWMLGAVIVDLGTGTYLASLVQSASVPPAWLIPLMFLIAAAMAFSTGTSWGSFGILLPLAGDIMNAVPGSGELLIAAFGAVLAGAVLGDHCSPISDTTILSSTGAACSVTTHVTTQLPYALLGAGCALLGYVAFALVGSSLLGLAVTLGALVAAALVLRHARPALTSI